MLLSIITIALLVILLLISYICYKKTFYVSHHINKDPHIMLEGEQYEERKEEITKMVDDVLALPFTDFYIDSFDGVRLHAAYYEVDSGAPLEIMFHGYKSIAIRDCCGAVSQTLNEGRNVLLVDQRAHGLSGGKCLTFGIKERYDCISWINFAREKFGTERKIILVGISMGAATVLMAAELGFPENVVGIIADSGYSSPPDIIKKVLRDMKLPVKAAYPFVYVGARLFGRFDLNECSAVSAVKYCKIPLLIYHGEDDRFVPYKMCYEIYENCTSAKYMLTVKNAGHGLSFLVDNAAYNDKLKEFLNEVL